MAKFSVQLRCPFLLPPWSAPVKQLLPKCRYNVDLRPMASRLQGHRPLVFRAIDGSYLLGSIEGKSLTANMLLANNQQLLMCFTYVIYNGVLTPMLRSKEYLRFSTRRKALRVSAPVGAQRSTYWLQVPYRDAVLAMAAMALLHWLISQSQFLARIKFYNYDYELIVNDASTNGTGWSPIALMFALILGLS